MPHVVTALCDGCKYTDCVTVCPSDCFREAQTMLVIDPEVCIDCEACVSECPVGAIFADHEVPDQWQHFIEHNARIAQSAPEIVHKKTPLTNK